MPRSELLERQNESRDVERLRLPNLEDEGIQGSMSKELDEICQTYLQQGKIQGAVLAVSKNRKPVYFSAHGLADTASNTKMKNDSIFQLWSLTKPVCGVAAMLAMERGLFKPEDEVSKYLPEFRDMNVAVLAEPQDEDISPNIHPA